MTMKKVKSRKVRQQNRLSEVQEIELLQSWIDSQKPDSGTNPLSLPHTPSRAPVGRLDDGSFSPYAGSSKFSQLPISKKTKAGLRDAKYVKMTEIQRASLPHSLSGRDILGAAKTGSGKTLAFIIPILEKLYKERWTSDDGVGSIIISPTRELAAQLFDVLKAVGKYHDFAAGLLIGGRGDVALEKENVNKLNILVCTPGRLLQHMDETPNFECSELKVLVLDEADRILDVGFKKTLNAIISQLPKYRQTLLFSATQTKSVQDLARLSLKDPEYLGVHEESDKATPNRLQQTSMIVPLEQKLDMLWSFIKAHLNSRILVFLSTAKQIRFVFEAFKKLRPGIPLKCLHGRMSQERRMGVYSDFCEKQSVLFTTDVASRGLDFNKAVDWVVQVDCPEDVASYIHRVGRTARYQSGGRSVLFLAPSEMEMLEKLKAAKVPVNFIKANMKKVQPISSQLQDLLAKYPEINYLAQKAFVTYIRSIFLQKDKQIFDVSKLSIDEYSASLGLAVTPKVRFLKKKGKSTKSAAQPEVEDDVGGTVDSDVSKKNVSIPNPDEEDETFFYSKDTEDGGKNKASETKDVASDEKKDSKIEDRAVTRVIKKKKLKINLHRPIGTRTIFDEEGETLPPLARLAPQISDGIISFDPEKKEEYYRKLREEMKKADKEDKQTQRQLLRERRMKKKMKLKKGMVEEVEDDDDDEEGDDSDSDDGPKAGGKRKRPNKKYFGSDEEEEDGEAKKKGADSISLAEQEELALKLLSSMH